MSPCYQGHIDCNEKERNATKSEMQSSAKHKLECFKGQGVGRITNQNIFDKMIKNKGDEYGIGHKTTLTWHT